MKTCSVRQMQEADRRAINEMGIPGCVLMYNAAKTVFDHIITKYKNCKNICILCGKGNNGGDGFAIAHLLKNFFGDLKKLRIIAFAKDDEYKGDAEIYLKLAKKQKIEIIYPESTEQSLSEVKRLSEFDLIVDALLGTGTRGEVREPYKTVINNIPSDKIVVAVDLPSGLNGDTGEVCGCCVKANSTVTFARAKQGIVNKPEYTGELIVSDIGIPLACLEDDLWTEFNK